VLVEKYARPTAAAGQCPQEVLQLVAVQLPQDAPPAVVFPIFPEKADIRRWVLDDLHFGQATVIFPSRFRKRNSKSSPHFRHRYS
jgi:hypothetical protein